MIITISYVTIIKKEGVSMKENILADLSMDFSVQIINLVKELKAKQLSKI